jgi:hypothetical protein
LSICAASSVRWIIKALAVASTATRCDQPPFRHWLMGRGWLCWPAKAFQSQLTMPQRMHGLLTHGFYSEFAGKFRR